MYRISDTCNACGACAAECKTGAIRAGDKCFSIDTSKCAKCGACADICPLGAAVKCD